MVKRVTIAAAVGVAMAAFLAGPGAGAAWADFVCPVLPISENAKQNTPDGHFITISDGDASILPGKAGINGTSPVDVADHATNDEGTGSAGGDHAAPGDPDHGYTAIWNTP